LNPFHLNPELTNIDFLYLYLDVFKSAKIDMNMLCHFLT